MSVSDQAQDAHWRREGERTLRPATRQRHPKHAATSIKTCRPRVNCFITSPRHFSQCRNNPYQPLSKDADFARLRLIKTDSAPSLVSSWPHLPG